MRGLALFVALIISWWKNAFGLKAQHRYAFHLKATHNVEIKSETTLPRLQPDPYQLVRWIEEFGGEFNAKIVQTQHGWSLATKRRVKKHETLLKIPKKLCISPEENVMYGKLSTNALKVMCSLGSSQWRLRLAVALLSERVRGNQSFFFPYIRNLPFEFWAMPFFFSSSEFK